MGDGINMVSIYATNGLAILLAGVLLFSTNWKISYRSDEYKYIRFLLIISIISSVMDPIVVTLDGHPGTLNKLINHIGNSWLYFGNVLVGPIALYLIIKHLSGAIPLSQKIFAGVFCSVGILALVINIFVPVVYSIDANNVYHREYLFWMYTIIEGLIILDAIAVYIGYKIRGGMLKFFPVITFVLPVGMAIAIQGMIYGISIIWPAIVISACGMLNGLRNEALFMDSLTGLYNRLYLEDLHKNLTKKKSGEFTFVMLDMNGFKSINDDFGHAEGDAALVTVAEILTNTVGALGNVIRYAGDEFVIILNTTSEKEAGTYVDRIRKNFAGYNETSGKGYEISASIGFTVIDLKNESMDDAERKVDALMYDEKAEYYKDHTRRREDRE